MRKSTRKPTSAQRDKFAVQTAKVLKKKGILSKQTKLHGGRFVSRSVLKKTQELRHLAFSIHGESPQYTTVKASKEQAKRARDEGYQVVRGNRIVVPKEHEMIRRVKRGELAGIVPVKGGFRSEVTYPFDVDSTEDLMNWLQTGDLEERKLEHEMFMFTFHGSTSRRAFHSAAQMRQYLEHYKQDEMMKALKIFRLHPQDQEKFIIDERVSVKRGPRGRQNSRGDYARSSYAERMARMAKQSPAKYKRIKAEQAAKWERRKAAMAADPKKAKDYTERSRARALAHYHANKPPPTTANRKRK